MFYEVVCRLKSEEGKVLAEWKSERVEARNKWWALTKVATGLGLVRRGVKMRDLWRWASIKEVWAIEEREARVERNISFMEKSLVESRGSSLKN